RDIAIVSFSPGFVIIPVTKFYPKKCG
ncbi:transposase, partial [Shigella boydii]|nr:transposase [Shigella flexneri]EAA0702835.1 transposase [Shigella boydii]EAA1151779.1 transposase [Shigella boydii]EAA1459837.1 transposase [Shigella flexneri]EAA1662576.1 transposase [Shigella boydii]